MGIAVPPYIIKETTKTNKNSIKAGLIRPQGESLENVELRTALSQAVDAANLNVSERAALNHAFYNGEQVFPLFKKGEQIASINYFHKNGEIGVNDSFTKEVMSIKVPEDVSIVKEKYMTSQKGNFQANLDNALKKLRQIVKFYD